MQVTDDVILQVMRDRYRNNVGSEIHPDLLLATFSKVRNLLHSLNGDGFSDLEILQIAAKSFEQQVIKDS